MLSGRLPATAAAALAGGVEAPTACAWRSAGRAPCSLCPGSLDAALTDLGSDVTVEFKLDGARIQVHRDGDVARSGPARCARSPTACPSWSSGYGPPVRHGVLDGETLAIDDDGRPRAFQDDEPVRQ